MGTPRMDILKNFTKENVLIYAQEKRILPCNKLCSCGHNMSIQTCASFKNDNVCWRCSKCKTRVSVRRGSFFENSKLTLSVNFQIIFDFVCQVPVTTSACLNGISIQSAIQWYEYCRDICTFKMNKDRKLMGGPGHEVQMDESLSFTTKHGRIVTQIWIIGFYDQTEKIGHLQQVPDRSAETIENVIVECVAPGSTIYTDEWKGYRNLKRLGYEHGTVNHWNNFVSPVTGDCTDNIVAYWSRIKSRLKYVSGSVGDMKWSHVDEAMYRETYNMTCDNPIQNYELFLTHIQENYPL